MAFPHWRELRKIKEACARLFAPVRYQSLDMATTQVGFLLVEVNTGGGIDLRQLASRSGFLSKDVRKFLNRAVMISSAKFFVLSGVQFVSACWIERID
jgi:hypothetical protein